jgi:hypothetical protein
MNDFGFFIFGTFAGLLGFGLLSGIYLKIYRRIPLLESFTAFEKRILAYQLYAISFLTTLGSGYMIYIAWFGFDMENLSILNGTNYIVLMVINWVVLGFVAITSLVPGVSVVNSIRSWGLSTPAKGTKSYFIGALILVLLIYSSWNIFR